MKKAIASLLIVLTLLVGTGVAVADTPAAASMVSLKDYSDDELVALLTQAQQEIADRNIEKTALLQTGTYIGGKDIPVGSYVLSSAGTEGQAGIVSLRSVNDPENDWPSKLYEFNRAESNYTVYVTIDEGDTLILPYPFELTISSGVMFK